MSDARQRLAAGFAARSRLTVDNPQQSQFFGPLTTLPDFESESRWRDLNLDSRTLNQLPIADIGDLLADISPEISRAISDFLRMVNPGFELHAYRPGTETVDTRAEALLQAFRDRLKENWGSETVVINRLFLNAFLRGGFFAELVLDKSGHLPVDLATPESRWLQFTMRTDPERGPVPVPFQWQNRQRVLLDKPTVSYVPVDPLPGKPRGRSLIAPAFFVCVFIMGMLHDLRRVVAQQGWPRIDITISWEELQKAMPANVLGDPTKEEAWLAAVVDQIKTSYCALEPEDAYVHLDSSTVNAAKGTMDTNSLGMFDRLFEVIERMAVRALKTNNLFFGLPEQGSETHSNRVWEIAAQFFKSFQHLAEDQLNRLLTLALEVQGVQASVKLVFAELRAAELMRDEQVAKLKLENAALSVALGYRTQDEGCQYAIDKDKAARPAPIIPGAGIQAAGTASPSAAAVVAEPGANRSADQANFLLDAAGITHKVETCQCSQCVRFREKVEEWSGNGNRNGKREEVSAA
jgi:hypothetical protein